MTAGYKANQEFEELKKLKELRSWRDNFSKIINSIVC